MRIMCWIFIIKILLGISILGNVSTNGVCKEWQLLRGKILSKCNQFFSAKKVARLILHYYCYYYNLLSWIIYIYL